jgi:ribonuclease P protein component
MISKAHRFHGRRAIGRVYRRGATVRGAHNALKYMRNTRRDSYRVAVVVSRKVSKSAVVRNRIRRRLYEALRQTEGAITEPYDLVFLVYSDELATIDAAKLQHDITAQLKKAGVIADETKPDA